METDFTKKTLKLSDLAIHNAVKNVTIASNIKDVISDYKCLQKEKKTDVAGKQKRSQVQPPNTSNFRQHNLIRDLTELGDKLKKEIDQCNRDELDRQRRLEEVHEKTIDLSQKFQEAEMAYNGVLKEREARNEVMKVFSEEVEEYDKTSKRFAKCGAALDEIRLMMEKVINENKCYTDFIESLAGSTSSGAASHMLAEFITEFETIETAKNTITGQMNEALLKAEKSQLEIMQIKNAFIRELKFIIEGLITSHSAMERAGVMNERYEKALSTMSVDAVEAMTTMARVLNSAEQMIENLIARKVVDGSYRRKTLAQQFEAIREDYLKKKAILHEYHKSKAKQDKKRAFMVRALDKEERLVEKMSHQKQRLKDLAKKRVKMAWISQRDQQIKKEKRLMALMPSDSTVEVEKKYNPLEEPLAVVDLEEEERIGKWSLPDTDDFDEDSCTAEDPDVVAVYSGTARDSLLADETEQQVSFMTERKTDVADRPGNDKAADVKKRESVMKRRSSLSPSDSSGASGSSNSSDRSRDQRMSSFFQHSL